MTAIGGFAAATMLFGCGGGSRVATDPAAVVTQRVPAPTRLDSVFVLESGGAPPDDTTVAIAAGQARVIIIRRGAPDNSLFAQLVVPAGTATSADSIRLTLRPRPGRYGVDVEGRLAAGAELTMSYAVHFIAPAGARARYGSDLGLEKVLFITQAFPDGRLIFLPTTRPGSDLVTATLPGPGRFLVAAPRN